MANKPMRPCCRPGCNVLTAGGYCDQHRPKYERDESAAWHHLYTRQAWRQLREEQLLREPWCAQCLRDGRRTRASVVDHIQPHRGELSLFYAASNLQSLCKRCHDRKTMQERRSRQK